MTDAEPNSPLRPWSITKSEWDGIGELRGAQRTTTRVANAFAVICGVALMFTPTIIGSIVGSPAPPRVVWMFRAIAAGFIGLIVLVEIWQRRAQRRWASIRPIVWEAHGCVCPWCKVRVDEQPCPKHGFTRDDQPKLIAYWETLPTMATGQSARALVDLRRSARKTPLRWRLLGPFQRAYFKALVATNDPSATPLGRLWQSLPWIAIKFAGGSIALAAALWLLPRSLTIAFISGCWPFLLVGPIFVLIGPLVKIGHPRCSACGHLCGNAQPTLCTECGADLTQPAAVRRDERSQMKALLFFIPLGIAISLSMLQDTIAGALPAPLRNAYWTNIKPPLGYWQNLNPAVMTQAEVDDAAQLLIDCAEPGRARPLFDFSFLERAAKSGKLSPTLAESAARATVRARLALRESGGTVTVTVHPEFGELILSDGTTPRLVFGGVSVDGGPYTVPADWSLFLHDVEEFWRRNGQLPALPEQQLVYRAELGKLAAGTHTIRARCWIVLYEAPWVRYQPAFGADGQLVPPARATVYELPLDTSFTSR